MTKLTKNHKEWRMSRHCAGVARRSYILGRAPLKRLCFLMDEGYKIDSMGLCYRRWLKLRLGGRRVSVANYIIVIVKEEKVQ